MSSYIETGPVSLIENHIYCFFIAWTSQQS